MFEEHSLDSFYMRYLRYNSIFIKSWSYFDFKGEPLSKKTSSLPYKIAFQNDLIKQFLKLKKEPYLGKIGIEMRIRTSSQNPPHIHSIPKNYLDLLHLPVDSTIDKCCLPFNNDNQISHLNVYYDIDNKNPGLTLQIYSMRALREALRLAKDVLYGNFDDIDSYAVEDIKNEIDMDSDDPSEDVIDDLYEEHINNKEDIISKFGEKYYNTFLYRYRKERQEQFLKYLKFDITSIYELLTKKPPRYSTISPSYKSYESIRKICESSLTMATMKLPRVPIKDGETKIFKNEVRLQFNNFIQKYKLLNPLFSPVSVEVVYRPPKTSFGFYKDLDNLMRMIVPIFHEIFKPPLGFKFTKSEIPKSVEYQLKRYEIVEIPRLKNDKPEGLLTLGICDWKTFEGIMGRARNVIEEANEHLD